MTELHEKLHLLIELFYKNLRIKSIKSFLYMNQGILYILKKGRAVNYARKLQYHLDIEKFIGTIIHSDVGNKSEKFGLIAEDA